MSGEITLIALESAQRAGNRVNQILSEWRGGEVRLIQAECPRFSSGEAKCILKESVRDRDVFILVDVCNWSLKYQMHGIENHMSPDDHYHALPVRRQAAPENGTRIAGLRGDAAGAGKHGCAQHSHL